MAETGPGDRVVVIGSGPCGAIAARELVRRGVDVTLLESGTRMPQGLVVRAAGNTVARKISSPMDGPGGFDNVGDPTTEWWRTLEPGGLSNHWTAAVPRFAPVDFGVGVEVDEAHRWPLTYSELEQYYELVEPVLKITGGTASTSELPSNAVAAAVSVPNDWQLLASSAAALGHGVVPLPMAKGPRWMIARRGTEFNSWTAIVAPLIDSERFRLELGAHVTRIRWSSSTGRADGVEYLDRRSGALTTMPARAVVVACGDLHSTKLLLNSTSPDFPTGLGDTHGVLGRYLHDHPKDFWTFRTTARLQLPAHPVYMTRAALDTTTPLQSTSWTIGLAQPRQRLRTYVGGRGRQFGVQVFGTMRPDPEHRVRLAPDSSDRFGQPRLRVDITYDQPTVELMEAARHRLGEVFTSAGLGYDADGLRPLDLRPGSSVHFAGSIRMHERPELGMLDRWNRLHAVPNVLVVDKSCFTTSSEKNPTLTAMALAARAAHHLADDGG